MHALVHGSGASATPAHAPAVRNCAPQGERSWICTAAVLPMMQNTNQHYLLEMK